MPMGGVSRGAPAGFAGTATFLYSVRNPCNQLPHWIEIWRNLMIVSDSISLPRDFAGNFLMLLRWIHFLAGITWIGLLYFFNLVGFRSMQELDPGTRAKVMPGLMLRALWWFRWSALITVLAGLAYWGQVVSALAQ